jgi:Cu(I)/Ag(I) efflux system membrane fusion protein
MKKIIVMLSILGGILFTACNTGSSSKNNSSTNSETETHYMTQSKQNEKHAMLNVKGSCEMCKERIENAAKEIEGVSFASWEMEKQVLHLNYVPDKTSTDDIAKALAAVGHDTDKFKATQTTYDALPACCKYRD